MWRRVKRVINSYLDSLIDRAGNPDREVRDVTRGEMARLMELEARSAASVKLYQKELAEIDLKLIGLGERFKQAQESGDAAAMTSLGGPIESLSAQRDLLKKQIADAGSAAARASALREERRRVGEELATETNLTRMKEGISSLDSSFASSDPGGTIEEMRERLGRRGAVTLDAGVAAADRELEIAQRQSRVDDILARYKGGIDDSASQSPASSTVPATTRSGGQNADQAAPPAAEDEPIENRKSLGRTDGPVRPLD
jgi:phage shock protein A